MAVDFDGPNLLITLESAITTVDAEEALYSDWKEWFKTDPNSKHFLAFDTTGGDTVDAVTGKEVSAYFFLRNDLGWRIKPPEEDIEITIVGNLYPRDSTLPMLVPTTGGFNANTFIERDASAVALPGSGLLGSDIAAIRAGLLTLGQFLALQNK